MQIFKHNFLDTLIYQNTHTRVIMTRFSVVSTRMNVIFTRTSVIMIRTSVIMIRTSVISTCRVCFIHGDWTSTGTTVTSSVIQYTCVCFNKNNVFTQQGCVLNRHALWHTNNTVLRVESTRKFLLCIIQQFCKTNLFDHRRRHTL
jgi:hypothetical protein